MGFCFQDHSFDCLGARASASSTLESSSTLTKQSVMIILRRQEVENK